MKTARRQLDNRVTVVTPENIAFEYHVAGPFRRLPAYLVDLAIRGVVGLGVTVGLSLLCELVGGKSLGEGIAILVLFILMWFYGGLFETFWNGQTPGKRLTRLRVLSVEGQAINASQAVLRNVLRAVDSLPGLYLVGLVAATMNRRYQRLGDLACGTMVVSEEPQWLRGVAAVNEPAVARLAASIPSWFQPSRSLSRALAMYVGRRPSLTPPRRVQIARYVGVPLRQLLGLPQHTDLDQLLCALYNRTFVGDDRADAGQSWAAAAEDLDGECPFAAVAPDVTVQTPGATGVSPVESPHGQEAHGVLVEQSLAGEGRP